MPSVDNRPLKVFLCHAHADRDPVRTLHARLTKDGVDAWLDKANLLPGQDWELEIKKAVREADVVVVCLSTQFNQAGFRQKEVRLALDTAMEKPEGEIFIIPARLEECDTLERLRHLHQVDLFEDNGYEMLMRALQAQAEKVGAILQMKTSKISKSNSATQNTSEKPYTETLSSGVNIGDRVSDSVVISGNGNTLNLNRPLLKESVSRQNKKELRIFSDLTLHYEHDIKNTNVETIEKQLLQSLTRIKPFTSTDGRQSGFYAFTYKIKSFECFSPKDGNAFQHAIVIHGTKSEFLGRQQPQVVGLIIEVPDMLIVTINQHDDKSRIGFNSDNVPKDVFDNLMNSILKDLSNLNEFA